MTAVSASTAQFAEQAARTTVWSRDQWLEALAWVPAGYELNEDMVASVANLAGSLGMTPRAAVHALFPDKDSALFASPRPPGEA